MAKKDLGDLLDNPRFTEDTSVMEDAAPVTPYDKAFSMLSTTRGEHMELMTRANPKMAEAARVTLTFSRFGLPYVDELMNQTMRFAPALNGEVRKEFVESLKGMGASMPDAFFEGSGGGVDGPPKSWVDVPEEE